MIFDVRANKFLGKCDTIKNRSNTWRRKLKWYALIIDHRSVMIYFVLYFAFPLNLTFNFSLLFALRRHWEEECILSSLTCIQFLLSKNHKHRRHILETFCIHLNKYPIPSSTSSCLYNMEGGQSFHLWKVK